MAVSLVVWKILALCAMLVIVGVLSLGPALYLLNLRRRSAVAAFREAAAGLSASNERSRRRRKRWISRLNCLSAGVFISTGLMDLYPDVDEDLDKYFAHVNIKNSFPLAPFLMLFGFSLILVVEQITFMMKERAARRSRLTVQQHDTDEEQEALLSDSSGGIPTTESGPLMSGTYRRWRSMDENLHRDLESSMQGIRGVPALSEAANAPSVLLRSGVSATNGGIPVCNREHHDEEDHHDMSQHPAMRVLILLCAMSLHSLFEGLSVGLENTPVEVAEILVALLMHKSIIAFSIGLNLGQSKLSATVVVAGCIIFSIASPIGTVLGISIIEVVKRGIANLLAGILQGIACGTFLYVTFFEILPHEFNSPKDRMLKTLFFLFGFGIVSSYLLVMALLHYSA